MTLKLPSAAVVAVPTTLARPRQPIPSRIVTCSPGTGWAGLLLVACVISVPETVACSAG